MSEAERFGNLAPVLLFGRVMLRYLVVSFIALFCFSVNAAENQCDLGEDCVEQDAWQIGIAFGAGLIANPLVDGDDIPLVILPDIAWYGESAYFDNGELGYRFLDEPSFSADAYAVVDFERAFFSFWHPSNVFLPSGSYIASTPGFTPEDAELTGPVSIDDVPDRDWTINGGLRASWYSQAGHFNVAWEHDLGNVHKGDKFILSYSHAWHVDTWRISLGLMAQWKSEELLDYYYGLDSEDGVPFGQFYQARSGWQPSIAFGLSRPINEDWQFLFRSSYQWLNSGTYDSPLVESESFYRVFLGAAYRF